MPSSRTLLRLAEQAKRDAELLEADLEETIKGIEDLRASIAGLREQEARFRRMAAGTETDLHTRSQRARINDVNDTARLNMSRANSSDPFVKACRAKTLTQNDVAKRVGIPRSLLSMYRSGVRKIPQARADAIETLTGWKATAKNWPGGILAGD